MTFNEMTVQAYFAEYLVPPTIEGLSPLEGGLTISSNSLKTWWPGTELNRRRQPFQGWILPTLSVDSARHSSENQPDFVLFIGARMEPSCKNLSLPRFASISTRLRISDRQGQISTDSFRQPIPTTQAAAVKVRGSVVSY
jgi:hypothetical protein